MIKTEDIIQVGKFQKTHALKGELNMISDIDAEYFKEGNPVIIDDDGIWVPFYAESIRPKGSTSYLIKLEGIDSEKDASQFINKGIYILRRDAEEWLEEDLVDDEELIGYSVIDFSSGNKIGEIIDIDDSTSNLLFIVENGELEETFYLPANEDLIEEVDDENKIIKLNIPEGLLDINR